MLDNRHHDVPPSWSVVEASGPGSFVTKEIYRRPDGIEIEWGSRRRRKGLGPAAVSRPVRSLWRAEAWSWQPGRIGWWISVLFMVGAALFTLGWMLLSGGTQVALADLIQPILEARSATFTLSISVNSA